MKRPVIDRDACWGAAVCVGIAPEVFELDDESKAVVKNPRGADEETIQRAIRACPKNAISWKEE